jgi:flavocytochrome c
MGESEETATGASRRRFLASAGLSWSAVLAGLSWRDKADAAPVPQNWDTMADVVVVGTGFAGLAAAIEARNANADVLVIDKMAVPGGNSVINGGDFGAAGTQMQKAAGIEDSPELMLRDMLKAGQYLNHPELARAVAEQSASALEWCQTYLGAKFDRVNFQGGHSVKRAHQLHERSGSGLQRRMLDKARELGVRTELRAKLTRLVADATGRIIGIEVRRRYRFPDDASGTTAYVGARKAIVLASGGFAANVALRKMYDPRLGEQFTTTNHPGATGDATIAACLAGAMDIQMDWIQLGPWTSPDEKGFGFIPQFVERVVGYGLMVDPATGRRFFKETGNRKERADAIVMLGHPVLMIADATNTTNMVDPGQLQGALGNGSLRRFDTLKDIAPAYGMPAGEFEAQVARWNDFVAKKKDAEFDCLIFPDAAPNVTPPFYVCRIWPRVHYTMGGLAINSAAQVIGFDLRPIPSLFAAGEATGGVHGAVRLGSCSMAACIVFGRIAGKAAAVQPAWA